MERAAPGKAVEVMWTGSGMRINTNDPNRPYASQKNQPPKFD